MSTNFFQQLTELEVQGTFKMAIHIDEKREITLSLMYAPDANGDKATKLVPPMSLKGTATELDEKFISTVTYPVKQTAQLFQNMESYMKGLEEARKQSQMERDKDKPKPVVKPAKSKADIELPEPKVDKDAKRKTYEEAMKKVAELNDTCKYDEALAFLPSNEDYPEKQAELDKKRADLNRKKEQLQLLM